MLSGSATELNYAPVSALAVTPYQPSSTEFRQMYSVEYRKDAVWIQSEYNLHRFPGGNGYVGINSDSYYVQGGYLMGKFLPFIRYESLVTNQNLSFNPNFYQRQWAIGTNYAITSHVNLRLEADCNHGYALPIASQGSPYYPMATPIPVGSGLPVLDWNEFAAELNFSF